MWPLFALRSCAAKVEMAASASAVAAVVAFGDPAFDVTTFESC